MSDIKISLPLPLDEDGFFRRTCNFCRKEFKVLFEKEELMDISQKGLDSFMIDSNEDLEISEEDETLESEFYCPYCGQKAQTDYWWTDEQVAFFEVVARNIIAKEVNEKLIRPLKRTFRSSGSGPVSLGFKGREMEYQEPWISPEINDMNVVNLPCCKRKIKIEDGWTRVVHCFFCGFPHRYNG
jgi:hypothetical protein